MSRSTRRDFLRRASVAGGMAALGAGCSGDPTSVGNASADTAGTTAAPAAAEGPAMAMARWKGAAAPEEEVEAIATRLTEQAIEALGGMKRFVSAGDVVCVKPNIGWDRNPRQAANTNPAVVETLVRLCLDAGAKTVKVGDHTCNDARKTYANSGIAEAAQRAGAEVFHVDKNRFREARMDGELLKTMGVYPEIVDCDLVISAPVAKHHGSTQVSLCMKNFMGVVEDRGKFHQDLPTAITDLTRFMKPRLAVLDAMRMLVRGGPTGGSLGDVERKDTIAAGTDIVALDAFGAELLGHKPGRIGTIATAHRAGLGEMDYRKLAPMEIAVS